MARAVFDGCNASNPAPCMGCERRAVGCHSGCADYLDYKARLRNAKREANEIYGGEISAEVYAAQSKRRFMKKRGQKLV